MTVTVLNLVPAKTIENFTTAQYTATGVKAIIDKFTVTNTSASEVTFTCYLVASGGSELNGNMIIKLKSIAPGETYLCPEMVGQTIEAGGFISTYASAANALTLRVSGRTIS